VSEVVGAGAQRVAIVRAIMKAEDPAQAAQRLLLQLKSSEYGESI
jgi:thiamine monophosphate synthase